MNFQLLLPAYGNGILDIQHPPIVVLDHVQKIKEINEFIDSKNEEVKKYEIEFEQLQMESDDIKRKIYRLNDNIDKFHLLKKNYLSDLERSFYLYVFKNLFLFLHFTLHI